MAFISFVVGVMMSWLLFIVIVLGFSMFRSLFQSMMLLKFVPAFICSLNVTVNVWFTGMVVPFVGFIEVMVKKQQSGLGRMALV